MEEMVVQTAEWRPRRVDGLDVCEVVDGYVVYEAGSDRVHYLNNTAALVLELCTGDNSREEIAGLLRSAFSLTAAPAAEVSDILDSFTREGLVQ
jgi:hypothetical protein